MRPFLIDRNSAEMLSDLLAWNLKYKSVNANSGDPWCEKLLNELCDTFKFGGKLGAEREETFELWALRVQGRITHTSASAVALWLRVHCLTPMPRLPFAFRIKAGIDDCK